MKLFAALASPYSRKVRIVLAEKHIEFELAIVDMAAAASPVSEDNPLGKVPTLLLDDGTALYDSRVIVEFLDNASPASRLIPEGNRERVAVRRWEALADGVLDAGLLVRYESLRPAGEQSADWVAKQMAKVHRGLARLDADLGTEAWCHGDRYSLADIALACCVGWLDFRRPGGLDWRPDHPNLLRHYNGLMERPEFSDTAPRA
jgi:glutathione S-transferase